MISSRFDLDEFVGHVRLLGDPEKIIAATLQEVNDAIGMTHGTGRMSATRTDSARYVKLLQGFLFFMRYAMKPVGLGDEDFARFRPVCESLVERGVLKPGVLGLFKKTEEPG
jgi:hypothetical protein